MKIRLSIEPGLNKRLGDKVVVRRGSERAVMFETRWHADNGMHLTGKKLKFEKSVYKREATLKLIDGAFRIYSDTRKAWARWQVPSHDEKLRTKAFATSGGIDIDLDTLAWNVKRPKE